MTNVDKNLFRKASFKWRDAQRAMRNRQFIGYTLGPLERNVRGRLFDSERGGRNVLFKCLIEKWLMYHAEKELNDFGIKIRIFDLKNENF